MLWKIDEPTVAPLADGLYRPINSVHTRAGLNAGSLRRAPELRWSVSTRKTLDLLRRVAGR